MEIDKEVYEIEERIARRRSEIGEVARATSSKAMQSLASPVALGTAVAVGFLAGGLINRKRKQPRFVGRRRADRAATKKTGIASMLAAGALTLVKARYGTPMALAQAVLARMRKPPPATQQRVA